MKVLVIEDDVDMRDALTSRLPAHGFAVDGAADGTSGIGLARLNAYDLILLDLNLPDMPGESIVKAVHQSAETPPILMLSVVADSRMKARLLNAGADDYLEKPFSFDELVARMRALLRRPHRVTPAVLSVADLEFDTGTQRVVRANREVQLTRIELALLEYLLREAGTVVSKETLIEHVWNSATDPFSNSLEAHLSNLRKKLGEPPLINTVHGRGYIIE